MRLDELEGGKAVLGRMLQAYGFSMQKELGDLYGLSSGTISTWVRREYFPGDVVIACALDTGVSLRWLATGAECINDRVESIITQRCSRVIEVKSFTLTSGNIFPQEKCFLDPCLLPNAIELEHISLVR